MCGIAGYYSTRPYDPVMLESMVETLHHRGPDSAGYYRSNPFHGGMRRLSINGLQTGDQPLYNADRSIVMFYNGEIYNYPEIRRRLETKGYLFRTGSDGEAITHLFNELGPRAFEELDGMYAIALWSETEKKLYLARDIPGEKPLYYCLRPNGELIFASELPAFRQFQGMDLTLNRQAIWDFPTFLWVPEPDTIYQHITILPRGHYMSYDGSKLEVHPIPNKFDHYKVEPGDEWQTLVDKTRAAVIAAVKSRLLADVPVGAFLSSGLDSSIVCTIAQKELGNLTTFSIGYHADATDPYEGHADESAEAAAYAEILGTTHHLIRVTGNDFKKALPLFCQRAGQPYAVSSGLGVMAVAQHARNAGIKTLLSGDGADELFGGYSWYRHLDHLALHTPGCAGQSVVSMHNKDRPADEIISAIASYDHPKRAWAWHYYAAEEEKRALFNRDAFSDALSSYRIFAQYKSTNDWSAMDYIRQDRRCYLPYEMMVKLDRMTMAHSVEGRAPLVAPHLLNLADGLSYRHMVKGGVLKPLLREAFADILPVSVTQRPKHGFRVPIDKWLNDDWHNLVQETFSNDSALNRSGFLSPQAAQLAQDMLTSRERIHGHTIFCFIMMNMWLSQNNP
ncbi:MAG: asparagine synthase (glutamine-hydrolyzing) [Micavibrio aeruginosavorus]|uniref:asparagine synthase (glutamine-hydrolyzing) n=1 Tax=Micavibrio aeruginosavorus TaxID=349221 RepID=A0A7T5UGJ3_9BACT|nr:MAG: asparagine synthase (glutamine-hydrolyzing) [Micavibrio aeruginosavorus]